MSSQFGAPARSQTAAGLLSLFLGGLGAGRFYLGYRALGLIQVVLNGIGLGLIVASLLPNTAYAFPRILMFAPGVLAVLAVAGWALLDAILMFAGVVKPAG